MSLFINGRILVQSFKMYIGGSQCLILRILQYQSPSCIFKMMADIQQTKRVLGRHDVSKNAELHG